MTKDERMALANSSFRVLYGKDSTPEERKSASDAIKEMVADGDICFKCRKNVSTVGCHGVRGLEVYDEYWCAGCYVKWNKQGMGKRDLNRLSDGDT